MVLIIAAIGLCGCDKPGTFFDVNTGKTQVVQIHAEWELEQPHLWDIKPPDRLDIIMWPDSMGIYNESAAVRCDNMGGELIYYPKTQQSICEHVDF